MIRSRYFFPIVLSLCSLAASRLPAQNFADLKPAPQQTAWQDLEFGVILHFSTNTFLNQEWGDGTADPKVFNPTQFDPDQWMQAIAASGAKYVVLVAKHHDGFCLWPTEQTEYSIRKSPWKDGKGDVVGDVARAARRHGLRFGVYLSPWDRHDPRYQKDPAAYDTYYLNELTELASNYGDLVEFWLDGAGSEGHTYNFARIIETLRTYQPNTIVFADTGLFEYGDARWVGNESGRVDFENWNVIDRHGYARWRPVESDTPLRHNWFWHPNDEAGLKSVDELLSTYEATVGRGAQLMLGVAPDSRGLLPDNDAARLVEFGKALQQRYGNNLALQHAGGSAEVEAALDGNPDTFWQAPAGSHHATLEVTFSRPVTFNRALTMEWLNNGQRVQQYSIDIWTGGKWQSVAAAQAIGHKKIDAFPTVTASRVRLNILSSTEAAAIREFQLYDVKETGAGK